MINAELFSQGNFRFQLFVYCAQIRKGLYPVSKILTWDIN